MKKKQNNNNAIIWGVLLIAILFLSLNLGFAISAKEQMEIETGQKIEDIGTTVNIISENFSKELETFSIDSFVWNETVKTTLLAGAFVWLIIYGYFSTEPKNLITDKAYGTARWGTLADIRDLFADVIMKKEIERAKKIKTPLGRFFAKRQAVKECRMYAEDEKKRELEQLELWYKNELKKLTNTSKRKKI